MHTDHVMSFKRHWSNDGIQHMKEEFQAWPFLDKVPVEYKEWAIGIGSRVYAGMVFESFQFKVLSSKWFVITFPVDDVLERLQADGAWWATIGIKLINDFKIVFSGSFTDRGQLTTNYNQFRVPEARVPNKLIDQAILNLDELVNFEMQFRKLMAKQNYIMLCKGFTGYLEAMELEQPIYQEGAEAGGRFATKRSAQSSRLGTIGLVWASLGSFQNDETTAKNVSVKDSMLKLMSWHMALDNDIFGWHKDGVAAGDFCPTSMTNFYIRERGDDPLTAIRKVCRAMT